MVWGHHTHVLQPVYFYHGKPIFFSTGNFVFGSIKSLDPASGIFQLTWDIHEDGSVALNQFQMIPTKIRHSKQEYRPLVLKKAADQKDCWQHVMGKSDRYDCTKLPDGFEKTGIVKELRARQQYDKPSVLKRLKMEHAIYVQQLRANEE